MYNLAAMPTPAGGRSLTIYSRFFWNVFSAVFFILVESFYLPFQKVFLYLFYRELKTLKAAD